MGSLVQTRLDSKTKALLERLVTRDGWTTSEVLRKGIHLVAREAELDKPIEIIGLGEFDSGISDLATNKKHLAGLGRNSMPRGKHAQRAKPRK